MTLLTVPEVAQRLRVSARTVRRLTDAIRYPIPHVRIGRRRLVDAGDLASWLQHHRRTESEAGALVRAALEGP